MTRGLTKASPPRRQACAQTAHRSRRDPQMARRRSTWAAGRTHQPTRRRLQPSSVSRPLRLVRRHGTAARGRLRTRPDPGPACAGRIRLYVTYIVRSAPKRKSPAECLTLLRGYGGLRLCGSGGSSRAGGATCARVRRVGVRSSQGALHCPPSRLVPDRGRSVRPCPLARLCHRRRPGPGGRRPPVHQGRALNRMSG
jgi:hypothetical protein